MLALVIPLVLYWAGAGAAAFALDRSSRIALDADLLRSDLVERKEAPAEDEAMREKRLKRRWLLLRLGVIYEFFQLVGFAFQYLVAVSWSLGSLGVFMQDVTDWYYHFVYLAYFWVVVCVYVGAFYLWLQPRRPAIDQAWKRFHRRIRLPRVLRRQRHSTTVQLYAPTSTSPTGRDEDRPLSQSASDDSVVSTATSTSNTPLSPVSRRISMISGSKAARANTNSSSNTTTLNNFGANASANANANASANASPVRRRASIVSATAGPGNASTGNLLLPAASCASTMAVSASTVSMASYDSTASMGVLSDDARQSVSNTASRSSLHAGGNGTRRSPLQAMAHRVRRSRCVRAIVAHPRTQQVTAFVTDSGPDLLLEVFFIPAIRMCFIAIDCTPAGQMEFVPGMTCWTGGHVLYVVAAMTMLLILYPIVLHHALHKNDSADADFKYLPRFNVSLMISEAMLCGLSILVPASSAGVAVVVLLLVLLGLLIANIWLQPCLGEGARSNHWRSASFAGAVWAAVMALVAISLADASDSGPTVSFFVCAPIVMYGMYRCSIFRAEMAEKAAMRALSNVRAEDSIEQRRANVDAIGNLALASENREKLAQHNAIPGLLAYTQTDDLSLLDSVARAMANLAVDPANRATMVSQGAVPFLVRCANITAAPFLQRRAAMALSNLSLHTDNAGVMAECRAIPALVGLIRGSDQQQWLPATRALGNLAGKAGLVDQIEACNPLGALVRRLRSGQLELRLATGMALLNMARSESVASKLVEAKAPPVICNRLLGIAAGDADVAPERRDAFETHDKDVLAEATMGLRVLAQLALFKQLRYKLMQMCLKQALIVLEACDNEAVQTAGMRLFNNLQLRNLAVPPALMARVDEVRLAEDKRSSERAARRQEEQRVADEAAAAEEARDAEARKKWSSLRRRLDASGSLRLRISGSTFDQPGSAQSPRSPDPAPVEGGPRFRRRKNSQPTPRIRGISEEAGSSAGASAGADARAFRRVAMQVRTAMTFKTIAEEGTGDGDDPADAATAPPDSTRSEPAAASSSSTSIAATTPGVPERRHGGGRKRAPSAGAVLDQSSQPRYRSHRRGPSASHDVSLPGQVTSPPNECTGEQAESSAPSSPAAPATRQWRRRASLSIVLSRLNSIRSPPESPTSLHHAPLDPGVLSPPGAGPMLRPVMEEEQGHNQPQPQPLHTVAAVPASSSRKTLRGASAPASPLETRTRGRSATMPSRPVRRHQ